MNKQRRVLITTTYNEMGIIIDTKAEEVSKDSPELDNTFGDPISRQAAGDTISRDAALEACYKGWNKDYKEIAQDIKDLPPVQPEIVRCKGCRHGVDYYHEGDCYCLNPKWGLRYFGGSWEFYCADAERRTDGRSGQETRCD